MKKIMSSLLVIAILFAFPIIALASLQAYVPNEPESSVKSEDGKSWTKIYPVYVKTTANEEINDAEFTFTYKSAITQLVCQDAGEFVVADSSSEGNSVKCKFQVPEEGTAKGSSILVGKIKVVAKADAADEDCQINYSFGESSGKVNPDTGINVPYIYMGAGILLAAGIYAVTKKKAKLY